MITDPHAGHSHDQEHSAAKEHSCCHTPHEPEGGAVTPSAAAKYFCPMCPGVKADKPGDCPKCGMALDQNPAFQEEAKAIYTCPMHPEIRQNQPGYCPICGMALEPVTVTNEPEADNAEAKDMTRRFWIATFLTAPVFLLAMAHFIPSFHLDHRIPPRLNQWIQFILTTPVVLGAGWPFFVRGWNSLRNRHLNMFTLIALGVGTAYGFSVAALFFPQAFPSG